MARPLSLEAAARAKAKHAFEKAERAKQEDLEIEAKKEKEAAIAAQRRTKIEEAEAATMEAREAAAAAAARDEADQDSGTDSDTWSRNPSNREVSWQIMMCLRFEYKDKTPTIGQVSRTTKIPVSDILRAIKYSRRIEKSGTAGQKYFKPQIAQEIEDWMIAPIKRRRLDDRPNIKPWRDLEPPWREAQRTHGISRRSEQDGKKVQHNERVESEKAASSSDSWVEPTAEPEEQEVTDPWPPKSDEVEYQGRWPEVAAFTLEERTAEGGRCTEEEPITEGGSQWRWYSAEEVAAWDAEQTAEGVRIQEELEQQTAEGDKYSAEEVAAWDAEQTAEGMRIQEEL